MNSRAATTNTASGQERRSTQAERGRAEYQERRGNDSQERRQAVDAAADEGRDAVEEHPPVRLHVIDQHRDAVADRDLVTLHPGLQAPAAAELGLRMQRGERRAPVEGAHAGEPARDHRGIGPEERFGGGFRRQMTIEHVVHHAALLLRRERQVAQQLPNVGALARIAGARVGVHPRLAVVRPEHRVTALEIAQVEAHVHRVRVPGEEHDGRVVVVGTLDLREHALFARLDEPETAEAEQVLAHHAEHQAVAVIARLDAVDGGVELRREACDVGEALQPGRVGVGRHRQGVLGAGEIVADDLHGAVCQVALAIGLHGGHPVAEEHVDVVILQRGVRHRHRQHRDLRLVTQVMDQRAE